jgi:hypothetical protein
VQMEERASRGVSTGSSLAETARGTALGSRGAGGVAVAFVKMLKVPRGTSETCGSVVSEGDWVPRPALSV